MPHDRPPRYQCNGAYCPACCALAMFGFNLDCGLTTTVSLLKINGQQAASRLPRVRLFCAGFSLMILYPKEMKAGLRLERVQDHVDAPLVSLLVWPYGLTHDSGVVFIVYFIATEATNIGANIFAPPPRRLLCQAAARYRNRVDDFVWCSVPRCRIFLRLREDSLLRSVLGLTTPDSSSASSVPIPIGLNLFWFYKIVSKARRMFEKGLTADAVACRFVILSDTPYAR